ncbi:MAG: tyrosine-type recombinase/integrase [candidate division WS1 bacterium]|jgi:integrase|nr:tyrosine-type recombinase/integrase [candidate division WS1 bacterium]
MDTFRGRDNDRNITWLSHEEVRRLLEVPNPGCPTGLRNRALLQLAYATGLRASELLDLRPADVNLRERVVQVREGKGGVRRSVGFDAETEGWLRAWSEQRPGGARFFFTTLQGNRIGDRYLRELVDRCAQKAGLDAAQVSPHTLRHSYATRLLQDGWPLPDVQMALGHARTETTLIYVHALSDAERNRRLAGRDLRLGGPDGRAAGRSQARRQAAELLGSLAPEVREALIELAGAGRPAGDAPSQPPAPPPDDEEAAAPSHRSAGGAVIG